jgi:ubiquinone/menaquinone biosynthesis C-methylase UbiE
MQVIQNAKLAPGKVVTVGERVSRGANQVSMSNGGNRATRVIRHHWDSRADTFDSEATHGLVSEKQRDAWLSLLSRLAGEPPQRALDVGCGTGFLALRLAELGHTVTGVDLSPQMIEHARRKAQQQHLQIDFRVADAADLDCADHAFDLVVARHVIWNLPDPQRGVAEWLRVLRPGGRLALVEGKWAENEALKEAQLRPVSRLLVGAVDTAAGQVFRRGRLRKKLLNWRYRRLEVELPFSGGPSAPELVDFLEANSLEEVSVEPLMNPALWGETPEFLRYLAAGTRSARL